jgi:hypothetical protein
MSEPLDHHHLPIFYLRGWRGPDGKVVRYWCPNGREVKASPTAPKNTGHEPLPYSLDGYPEDQPQVIEKEFLARVVDDPASRPKGLDRARSAYGGNAAGQGCVPCGVCHLEKLCRMIYSRAAACVRNALAGCHTACAQPSLGSAQPSAGLFPDEPSIWGSLYVHRHWFLPPWRLWVGLRLANSPSTAMT